MLLEGTEWCSLSDRKYRGLDAYETTNEYCSLILDWAEGDCEEVSYVVSASDDSHALELHGTFA